ncbi:MAG TPA: isoleucine--tRNA ligase [Dongiaceae bacterium]|nr:isoleucine--tRNA ligase [Dongiaceae bacterium]
MDYKNTLNLPQTDFPMKADLVRREPERLKKWTAAGLYEAIQAQRAGAAKFVLHDGPPFANGDVHIGHVLNKVLKDIIVKYKTLRGFHAPYVPGWDCHGLPIEFKVVQDMRKAGDTALDPAAIRTACQAYARKYIDIQRTQFKRLGVLGDWDHPYLTLDKEYEAEELRLLADLVEQGFVYRGKKPVYWSIPCRTALAEAEVEYKDHVSQSVYVKFPVVGRPGVSLVIWTTTPWTLPANLAVAYNSTFSYSLVQVGPEQFIVSAMLLSAVAEKCGWQGYQIVRSLDASDLSPLEYQHPFCRRTGRLFAGDSYVDNATGTGFVHTAPGHGLEDYLLGREHGLPIYSPVDDDGRFVYTSDLPVEQQMPAEMLGKAILEKHGKSEANEAVLEQLRRHHTLLRQENYSHSYPHCWRSKTPIIFRAMDQWFIEIDHVPPARPGAAGAGPAPNRTFRQRALDEIARVNWVPDWGKNRIEAAVQGRPDWCISRQRAWGVPIPAFYDAQGKPILEAGIVRRAAELIRQHGSNVWFEQSAAQLWAALKPADWTGPEAATKSTDTLDVWIDSGSSSRTVIAQRPELRGDPWPFQCDLYLEGSDQHRGWFQSSLLLSLADNGAAPYRTVLTHGFMVDEDRAKISKSKQSQGGYEKPQTSEAYIHKHGADVVRLWVASQDYRNDLVVSEKRLEKVAETYRIIRNALRYQLSNLYDFDPAKQSVPDHRLTGLDRWVLDEFSRLEREILRAYDNYEFHVVYQRLSQFVAVELSAVYHDVVKDRLYTDPANSPRRRSTQTALHRMVVSLCKTLAPVLSFTADEAWEFVPGKTVASVHQLGWQPSDFELPEAERGQWANMFALRGLGLAELEKARQAKLIGKALEAKARVTVPASALAPPPNAPPGSEPPLQVGSTTARFRADFWSPENQAILQEILNVSALTFTPAANGNAVAFEIAHADGQKCERCWHWETDVGSRPEHPTLCARCVQAVKECAGV